MTAKGMPFPWRANGGTISTNFDVIWGMSDQLLEVTENEDVRRNDSGWIISREIDLV